MGEISDLDKSTEIKTQRIVNKIEEYTDCKANIWIVEGSVTIRLRGDIKSQQQHISNMHANSNIDVRNIQRYRDWSGEQIVTFDVYSGD